MTNTHKNAVLSSLLVDIARCLLQYVGECWPWTAGEDSERQALDELVRRQQGEVVRLVALLEARREPVSFGAYPTDFTDLHYLSLGHLLGLMIDNEEELINIVGRAADACGGDSEARILIEQIQAEEREILSRLRDIAAARAPGNAA